MGTIISPVEPQWSTSLRRYKNSANKLGKIATEAYLKVLKSWFRTRWKNFAVTMIKPFRGSIFTRIKFDLLWLRPKFSRTVWRTTSQETLRLTCTFLGTVNPALIVQFSDAAACLAHTWRKMLPSWIHLKNISDRSVLFHWDRFSLSLACYTVKLARAKLPAEYTR